MSTKDSCQYERTKRIRNVTDMPKQDNVKILLDCWNASAGKVGQTMSEDRQAEMWSKRSGDFAKHVRDKRGQKRSAEILEFLEEAGFRAKGAKVLDIGCGPGTLSIPLARAGADVTSLDVAPGMLAELKKYAEAEKIPVHPVECSWWTADIDKLGYRKKFDLVLASMTPGVKDAETMDRMMACSKKYCYYSNFLGGGMPGMAQREIREILDRNKPGQVPSTSGIRHGHGPGIVYPFFYLYTSGYRPFVRFNHNRRKEETEWQKAADRMIEFLEHEEPCDAAAKRKIRAYYKTHANDGRYTSQSDTYTAMMVWTVKNSK
jgi:SAM-dependent methyltransferase